MAQQLTMQSVRGPAVRRTLPGVPITIFCNSHPANVAATVIDGETWFRFTPTGRNPSAHDEDLGSGTLDAYKLRGFFLSIESEIDALSFLTVCGDFMISEHDHSRDDWFYLVSWADIQDWQKLVGDVLVDGFFLSPETLGSRKLPAIYDAISPGIPDRLQEWLWGRNPGLLLTAELDDKGRRLPELIIETPTALEAILASIFVDGYSEAARYRRCQLEGCGKLFSMEGQRQDKTHCTPKHAHHASVRRIRAKQQAEREGKEVKRATEKKAKEALKSNV